MRKIAIFSLGLLIILSLTMCSTATKFDGNRTGNDNELIMDFKVLNREDYQVLKLEQGDIVDAEIISNSGQLDIVVQKDNDSPIYKGKSVPTSSFQIEISESGTYKFSVKGKNAKGSVSFIKRT